MCFSLAEAMKTEYSFGEANEKQMKYNTLHWCIPETQVAAAADVISLLSFALALVSRFTCCCYESFCFYSAAAFVKVQTFILAILLLIIPGNPHRVITLTHTNGVEFSPFHCVIACVVRLVYANKNHISSLVWHSSSFSAA